MRVYLVFAACVAALLSVALVVGVSPSDLRAANGARRDFTKKTVSLSTGIEMKYVEAGDPAGADVVILLHGYTDSSRSFYPTIESLLERNPDLRILAPDLRGHGDSSLPLGEVCAPAPETCFEMVDFAADVFALMAAKGIASAHLVGHSMGSLIAQRMALTHPQKVESMVLIGTAARLVENPVLRDFLLEATIEGNGDDVGGRWRTALEADPRFGVWPQDAYTLTPLDADPGAQAWMKANWVADATADPHFLEAIATETARVPLGTWLGAAKALYAVDNTADLSELRVDSLTIWATQDVVFPESDQTAWRAALRAASTTCRSSHVWKRYGKKASPAGGQTDLGHNTQWGAPAQIAADIDAYIRRGAPTPDLYFANPHKRREIRTERGVAEILRMPAMTGCAVYGENLDRSPHGTWLGDRRDGLVPIAVPEVVDGSY